MSEFRTASAWLELFKNAPKMPGNPEQYRRALQQFISTFGNLPVGIVRAPGRVNLRGMHVDTHGGWLNLMTHQREIVVVFAPTDDGRLEVHNTEATFHPVNFDLASLSHTPAQSLPWDEIVSHAETQNSVEARRGKWDNYLIGAACRVLKAADCSVRSTDRPKGDDLSRVPKAAGDQTQQPKGMLAVVSGEIPRGAALSSSHALSVAMLLANAACQNYGFSPEELILAARDVEWYAGARTGTADQAAIVLGQPGKIVHATLLAEDFSTESVRYFDFPEALDLLVAHSHTTRNLSGEHKRAYTLNRFAYSIALDVLRQTLEEHGKGESEVSQFNRLSKINADRFGGLPNFYCALKSIPNEITMETLKNKYKLPSLEESFERYFAGFAENEIPKSINLRGPLLFGISESERAHGFAQLLAEGRYAEAGRLMNIGHDGDRVRDAAGNTFKVDLSDAVLEQFAAEEKPVAECSGYYGASSPVLDLLVDTALAAGALGASLTGAGIAGSVLVLCEKEKSPAVMQALRAVLGSSEYATLAKLPEALSGKGLEDAVMVNCAVDGAGYVEIEG